MKIWEILVPTQTNASVPVRTRQYREWDQRVRRVAGGLTVLQPAYGQWLGTNELFIERMIPVRIACDDDQTNKIADITAAFYEQEAMMFYYISDDVHIKNYK